MINPFTSNIADWEISIKDNGVAGRNKSNPSKLNYLTNDRTCKIVGCGNQINIRRTSGLCDDHLNHEHDLLLELECNGVIKGAPTHKEIIDALVKWSITRNYNLTPLFSSLSFNVLGNIPDVTTLAGKVTHPSMPILPDVEDIFYELVEVIENFFSEGNNSSFQPLATPKGDFPVIVLAHIYAGLLLCEEANRGDRWFCRMIMKDESRTTQSGAGMSIGYFAKKTFPWGVEMNDEVLYRL